jgi:hypothetical protein
MRVSSKKRKVWLVALMAGICSWLAWTQYREHAQARENHKKACYEALYQQALAFERTKNLSSAIGTYSYLCDGVFYTPGRGREHPCQGESRISRLFGQVYREAMQALSVYKANHGRYPSSLNEVMPLLPLPSQEVAQRFSYCKKEAPGDRSAPCSDGSTFFGDNEISVGTGEYGSVSFSLDRTQAGTDTGMLVACRGLQQ